MAYYTQRGKTPKKRHTVFRRENGELYHEELFGREGFSGRSALFYHLNSPTRLKSICELTHYNLRDANVHFEPLKIRSNNIPYLSNYMNARCRLMVNNDLEVAMIKVKDLKESPLLKNSDGDELFFVFEGNINVKTQQGNLRGVKGDYISLPKGTVYQLEFLSKKTSLLNVLSYSFIDFPKEYLNKYGQFQEHAPFCERDLKLPEFQDPVTEKGDQEIIIRRNNRFFKAIYDHHPFDLVGWDGALYPFSFSINDFEPITGRIHQPPTVHQTFFGHNFVICSFCPRLYDYHPEAIPAPYHHSNIDSDEVLFYVEGNFMSRKDVEAGDFTLHPLGIPHGPHPGAIEKSIGKKETQELAVMIDTFKPLNVTTEVLKYSVKGYDQSWL